MRGRLVASLPHWVVCHPERCFCSMWAPSMAELLVCSWRHGGHVGGPEQKHSSPLGTKLYFHVNSSRKDSFVLTPNMAALSRGCKPRIRCPLLWLDSVLFACLLFNVTAFDIMHVALFGSYIFARLFRYLLFITTSPHLCTWWMKSMLPWTSEMCQLWPTTLRSATVFTVNVDP